MTSSVTVCSTCSRPLASMNAKRPSLARVGLDEELPRAQAAVARGAGHAHGGVGECAADPVVERRRRGDLDQLLVPALDAAVAVAEAEHRPVVVTGDLHLDVPGALDEPLDVDVAVAERRRRLRAGALDGLGHLVDAAHDAHPAAAAAGDRLDDHRRPGRQRGEELFRRRHVDRRGDARHDRHRALDGEGAGPDLVTEQRQRLGGRADEGQTGVGAQPGEPGVLRQEPVARVHGVAAAVTGDGNDLLGVEVRTRTGATQGHRLVGAADVQRAAVVGGEHRHRRHAEVRGGTGDADRDLPPIGDQQLQGRPPAVRHIGVVTTTPWPRATRRIGSGRASARRRGRRGCAPSRSARDAAAAARRPRRSAR